MVSREMLFQELKKHPTDICFHDAGKGGLDYKIFRFLFLFDSLLKLIGVFTYVKVTL